MEDPWAAWSTSTPQKPVGSDAMRMPRMSSPPAPEPSDLDPWAKPTPAKAQAAAARRSPSPVSPPRRGLTSPPKSPSKLSLSTLPSVPSPPLNTGLGFPSALSSIPKLDGWDDVGWGAPPKPTSSLPDENTLRAVRSPSPELDIAGGWGAPSPRAKAALLEDVVSKRVGSPALERAEPTPARTPSPSPSLVIPSSPPKHISTSPPKARSPSPNSSPALPSPSRAPALPASPRKPIEVLSRVLSGSGELPRLSLETDAFSRPGSARLSLEESAFSQPDSPKVASPPSPPASLPGHALAFDTSDLGAGFATPFGPSSPPAAAAPALGVPETELRRNASFGSDFGGFAAGEEEGGGWGDTSWKDDTAGGWKDDEKPEEGYGGWGDVPRGPSPVKHSQQELDWEAAQKRMAAADARAPHEKIMALRKGWEDVASAVIGENGLETSEDEERKLDDGARELEENVRDTLRSLTDVPDTSFAFAHSATRERYAQALARAPPNMTSLLRLPVRSRRLDAGGLDFGPGLEGWAARSRLGEPDATPAAAAAAAAQDQKGWSFWRRQTTPKPLVTSGGGVLEVKTDLDAASIHSGPASMRGTSRAGSIASRPGTPLDIHHPTATPDMPSTRASISSMSMQPRVSTSSIPTTQSHLSAGGAAPSPINATLDQPTPLPETRLEAAPAPSRMSRLFRWGRKPDATVEKAEQDKELELGESDFAFLGQVPSVPGTSDLLGGGMSSLDDVLGPIKKEVPLPAPLAPPPRSSPRGLTSANRPSSGPGSRTGSGANVRMVAKGNDFDLLAGLDFEDPSPLAPPAPATSSTAAFAWDDFLAPSASSPSSWAVPKVGALSRTSPPPVMGLGTLGPQRSTSPPVMGASPAPMPPSSASPPRASPGFASFSSPPLPKQTFISTSLANPAPGSSVSATPSIQNPPTPERPRYGPSGPALGVHARHRSGVSASGSGGAYAATQPRLSPKPVSPVSAVRAPVQDFGFGDLSFAALEPMPAQANNFSSMVAGSGMGTALAPSPPPTMGGMDGMIGMKALAPSPRPSNPMGGIGMGMAALSPSLPSARRASPGAFAIAPPPSSSPVPATAPARAPAPAKSDDDFGDFGDFDAASAHDDFGDFGDFGSFSASQLQSSQPTQGSGAFSAQPSQPPQSFGEFSNDGFGDLSSFGFGPMTPSKPAPSSAAPTPIAKSIPPTPIEKSPLPKHSFPSLSPTTTSLTPSGPSSLSRNSSLSRSGASLSRNSSQRSSQSPPVFTRPAGLPVGLTSTTSKSRQSSFTERTRPSMTNVMSPTPLMGSSKRTPSVDHRATLTLMAAAHAADTMGESAPLSPVPEPLSPPPAFAGLIPPPPGGAKSRPKRSAGGGGGGLIDLMDD